MNLAVMQPYIFPYLGYYQLAAATDTFVFFDDVNFINKGWINRNRILQQNEPYRFSIALSKASQNRMINEIEIADYTRWKEDFLRLIEFNYKKAPHFDFVRNWLSDFLYKKNYRLISELAAESVTRLSELFELNTNFLFSSELHYRDENIKGGQEKIVRICELLRATKYINPQNGMDIYDEDAFHSKDIQLKFLIMDDVRYKQLEKDKFASSLSIIDVIMFNDLKVTKELLNRYTLINKQEVK